MKKSSIVSLVILTVSLFMTGCGNKAAVTVDTAPLENAFKGAEATVKTSVDKAVSEIKAGDYSTAIADLKSLGEKAKLNPDQQATINNLITQVQQALANAGKQAADGANKAAQDLQKSLPK